LQLLPNEVALFEPDGGVLDPERAVGAHLRMARKAGADLRFQTTMRSWEPSEAGTTIVLDDGSRISAKTFVLSLGPWFKDELERLGIPIRVQRNVLGLERKTIITTEKGELFMERTKGNRVQLFPESSDIFFRKGVEGRILFHADGQGRIDRLIDRRNNEDVVWKKVANK
jgi:glycine/D-amino acid oxidase-like deaminating enzyme